MLKKILCAATLLASPLIGETIGNVDYKIPESAKAWKVANEMTNPKSSTVIYIPHEGAKNDQQQTFTVHSNTLPSDITDDKTIVDGLLKTLEIYYPSKKVQGQIVEKDKDSILFEWSVEDQGKEVLHGWYRMFGSAEGTVLLGYQTGDISGIEAERAIWVPALKAAKQINK